MVFKNEIKLKNPIVDGKFQFGIYENSFEIINLLEAKNPFGKFSPKWLKKTKLKEWQAFQIGNENFFILAAVYNAKIKGIVEFLFYDKKKKSKFFFIKNVLPNSLTVPNSLHNSVLSYNSRNFFIECKYDENYCLKLKIRIKNFDYLPEVDAEFNSDLKSNNPLVVCIPFAENRGMYSQKSALFTNGFVKIEDKKYEFESKDSFLILDDHKGYYPNPMIYDWCTGIKNINGEIIAFNLTDNQSANPELYNENCVWIKNKIYHLPPVKFYRPEGEDNEWIIKDKSGNVDIKFIPDVENKLKFDYGIAKADYSGPFGYFSGKIKTSENEIISVDNFFGMGEKKFVKG